MSLLIMKMLSGAHFSQYGSIEIPGEPSWIAPLFI